MLLEVMVSDSQQNLKATVSRLGKPSNSPKEAATKQTIYQAHFGIRKVPKIKPTIDAPSISLTCFHMANQLPIFKGQSHEAALRPL